MTTPGLAKGWNNIFPLKTTRAEVLKILGDPKPFQGRGSEYWEYENDGIRFLWTLANCFDERLAGPDARIYGTKSIIDEKYAEPDALVYRIIVEPKDPNSGKYEGAVRDLLAASNSSDCIGTHGGACGIYDSLIGLSYNRDDRGIKKLEYTASLDEERLWRLQLKPCLKQTDHKLQSGER